VPVILDFNDSEPYMEALAAFLKDVPAPQKNGRKRGHFLLKGIQRNVAPATQESSQRQAR
jgi:hypothetical protein